MKWKLKSAVECEIGVGRLEMTSVRACRGEGRACGTPPGMRPHLAVKRKRAGPVEGARREGVEQVWVEPAGRFLEGAAAAGDAVSGQRSGVVQWVAGGWVNTFRASRVENACQAVAGSQWEISGARTVGRASVLCGWEQAWGNSR